MFKYDEIKNLKQIADYFEIKPDGNWENKIILVEKKEAIKRNFKKTFGNKVKKK